MKISSKIGHLRFSLDKFSGSIYDRGKVREGKRTLHSVNFTRQTSNPSLSFALGEGEDATLAKEGCKCFPKVPQKKLILPYLSIYKPPASVELLAIMWTLYLDSLRR